VDAAGVVVGTVEVEEAVGSTAGGSLAAVQQHTAVVAVQQEDTDTAPVSCRSGSHRAAVEVLTSSPETLPTQITIYTGCVSGVPKDLIKKSLGTPVVVCNVWLGCRRHFWSGKSSFGGTPRHAACPFDKSTARPTEFPRCSPSRLERASTTSPIIIH